MTKHLPLILFIGLALNINNDLVAQNKSKFNKPRMPGKEKAEAKKEKEEKRLRNKKELEEIKKSLVTNIKEYNSSAGENVDVEAHTKYLIEKYDINEDKNKQKVSRTSHRVTPCNDKKYLELKRKDLDDLTDKEFQYLMFKEKNCEEWRNNNYKSNKIVEKPSYRTKRNSPNKETSNAFGQLGNELLNLLNESTKLPEFSTNKNNRRCTYDGELLSTLGMKGRGDITRDHKSATGYKCFKCGRKYSFVE